MFKQFGFQFEGYKVIKLHYVDKQLNELYNLITLKRKWGYFRNNPTIIHVSKKRKAHPSFFSFTKSCINYYYRFAASSRS